MGQTTCSSFICQKDNANVNPTGKYDSAYVGSLEQGVLKYDPQYLTYTQELNSSPFEKNYKQNVKNEFSKCLLETSLEANDVDGILKLAQSAHISNEIKSGPYRGLSQHESAVEVATVVNEQFNTIDNMRKRGELCGGGLPGVNEELKKREMDTPGVIEAVFGGWDRFASSEQTYQEIMESPSIGHQRSDLTDENASEFATPITNKKDDPSVKSCGTSVKDRISFSTKAKIMGFHIVSESDKGKLTPPSLFPQTSVPSIPQGFEQINDDLYARKENKFMVFNGAALETWPPRPETKLKGIEEDMLVR